MPSETPIRLRGLYAVSPELAARVRLLAAAEQVLAGGAALFQYRDKCSAAAEKLVRAQALRRLCNAAGVPLIINDSVDLAAAVAADGVHLGAEDSEVAAARARLGPRAIIGVSCYASLARAEQAIAAGANYVAFGAAFPSASKPGAPPVSLPLIAEACRRLPVPVAAIGGITADNARVLVDVGVSLLAVINDVFSAPDVAARARQFMNLYTGSSHEHAQ
jgi:thiamine-phosphate pyrophosphorylase